MSRYVKVAVTVAGAAALTGSVLSYAGAAPSGPRGAESVARRAYSFNGKVNINNVLTVKKNASVYGKTYAHGGAQVWGGLVVNSGGVKTDQLAVTGPINVLQSATFGGSLQAGSISSSSLQLTGSGNSLQVAGNATVGGSLTVNGSLAFNGKLSTNGLDAGSGGLTTTGNISGGNLAASSINDSGSLSAGSITTSGALQAGSATLSGLAVSGNVNFSGATVSGLTLSSVTVGSNNATSNPLTLNENGKSASLGVNSNGNLSVTNFDLTGTLIAPIVSAPPSSALSLQGSGITLNGTTTLFNGSDLMFTANNSAPTSGVAGHIVAQGDYDIAGQIQLVLNTGAGPTTEISQPPTHNFLRPYTTQPIVVLTPVGDPQPNSCVPNAPGPPKVWVSYNQQSSGSYTGFEVHYEPSGTVLNTCTVNFNFIVIGQ